jgi:hypothetical protein
MRVLRGALLGFAFLVAGAQIASAAEDSLTEFDDFTFRSFTILKCHPSQDAADRAHLAREDAVRRSALQKFWAQLDAINPARHTENGKLAEETLARRTAAHDRFIQSQVIEYGCDWLDGKVFPPAPRP